MLCIMMKLVVLVFAVVAVSGQNANFNGGDASWYCDFLAREDCMKHEVDERCGTDGKTYRNMCAIGQAHCIDPSLNQYHEGPCVTAASTTTLSPEQVIHGSQIILDFQCAALSHRDCVNAYNEKICGTNGRTYENLLHHEMVQFTTVSDLKFCMAVKKRQLGVKGFIISSSVDGVFSDSMKKTIIRKHLHEYDSDFTWGNVYDNIIKDHEPDFYSRKSDVVTYLCQTSFKGQCSSALSCRRNTNRSCDTEYTLIRRLLRSCLVGVDLICLRVPQE